MHFMLLLVMVLDVIFPQNVVHCKYNVYGKEVWN
jgi:hypothetical protein